MAQIIARMVHRIGFTDEKLKEIADYYGTDNLSDTKLLKYHNMEKKNLLKLEAKLKKQSRKPKPTRYTVPIKNRLTSEEIQFIFNSQDNKDSLAKEFNISKSAVYRIKRGIYS